MVETYQVMARFEALDEGILIAPSVFIAFFHNPNLAIAERLWVRLTNTDDLKIYLFF
jgi:hypothetical protein